MAVALPAGMNRTHRKPRPKPQAPPAPPPPLAPFTVLPARRGYVIVSQAGDRRYVSPRAWEAFKPF